MLTMWTWQFHLSWRNKVMSSDLAFITCEFVPWKNRSYPITAIARIVHCNDVGVSDSHGASEVTLWSRHCVIHSRTGLKLQTMAMNSMKVGSFLLTKLWATWLWTSGTSAHQSWWRCLRNRKENKINTSNCQSSCGVPGEVPDDRGNEVPEDEGQRCVDLAVWSWQGKWYDWYDTSGWEY